MDWLESLTLVGAAEDLGSLTDLNALRELNLSDVSALTQADIAALNLLSNLAVVRLPLNELKGELSDLLSKSDLRLEEYDASMAE